VVCRGSHETASPELAIVCGTGSWTISGQVNSLKCRLPGKSGKKPGKPAKPEEWAFLAGLFKMRTQGVDGKNTQPP
jgi:hypothetical protein